jgi:hypothetical protein
MRACVCVGETEKERENERYLEGALIAEEILPIGFLSDLRPPGQPHSHSQRLLSRLVLLALDDVLSCVRQAWLEG